jgi:LemA protein
LSRLLVVVERYPDLKATQNFRDLQAQLEGTENRITVERMRFNEAAQAFNAKRNSFPTLLIASAFGGRFEEKGYFRADPGAAKAPKVTF